MYIRKRKGKVYCMVRGYSRSMEEIGSKYEERSAMQLYYKQNCLRTYGRTRQNKSVRQYGNIG